jgi:hypothetical protein
MKAIVFVGPTLAGQTYSVGPEFDVRAPAAKGDIYRAAQEKPAAIGLIDGLFETVPSVWHKEILWAMSGGVQMFGAASMGALRAAELDMFGMIGVGSVYRKYRDKELDRDDEVAVIYAPRELGYQQLSVALVDIRATLSLATERGILTEKPATGLLDVAQGLHFKDRTWQNILVGLSTRQARDFRAWLRLNFVEQKKSDANKMLKQMTRALKDGSRARKARFRFQHTVYWEALTKETRSP